MKKIIIIIFVTINLQAEWITTGATYTGRNNCQEHCPKFCLSNYATSVFRCRLVQPFIVCECKK